MNRFNRTICTLVFTIRAFRLLPRIQRWFIVLAGVAILAMLGTFTVMVDSLFFGGPQWHFLTMVGIWMAYLVPLLQLTRHPTLQEDRKAGDWHVR